MNPIKNPEHVISGLKAALHNPNVSQAAKVRDAARLKELEQELARAEAAKTKGGKRRTAHGPEKQKKFHEELMAEHQLEGDAAHETHVIAGYKSALKNPRVSAEAKEHASEFLAAHGAL